MIYKGLLIKEKYHIIGNRTQNEVIQNKNITQKAKNISKTDPSKNSGVNPSACER